MDYNFRQSQASFNYLERGGSGLNGGVGGGPMDPEDEAASPAAALATAPGPAAAPTAAPFHYLINEQAKSIAALQELQNEVSALLEFRDLVMETFPHLRKEEPPRGFGWEPGVRVRRKLRDRSNSQGHKAATTTTKATDSGSSTVQDSGFCADSSKEHCSGSTKAGAESEEDELWTLLELIEVRGTLLRREAQQLRDAHLQQGQGSELGALDGVLSRPSVRMRGAAGVRPDPDKVAAILRETSVLELRRHLLTTVFDNQVVRHRLGEVSRAHRELSLTLDKAHEDNEDLRFQLEEKSIELEGTRARVRLLERLHPPTPPAPPPPPPASAEQSSTESAHHDDKRQQSVVVVSESPKRRPPSRIPLKSYSAPKPPTPAPAPTPKPPGGRAAAARRGRKSSQDSFTSTLSTPPARRDPPSSPDSKLPTSEFPDSLDTDQQQLHQQRNQQLPQQRSFFDSIDAPECDSLDDLV